MKTYVIEAIDRQITRLKRYSDNPQLDTQTKYFSQRDNYKMPHRTCNSSSNAIYVDWLLRATGREGLENDDRYMRRVFLYGDTIYHGVQTKAIKDFGFSTKWMTDRDLPFIEGLITTGFPVVTNILHRGTMTRPRGGHVIVLIGQTENSWIVHDPYGTLKSNYRNQNGAYARILKSEFEKRWQGGYRILA